MLQELQLASGESVPELRHGSGFRRVARGNGARGLSVEIDALLATEAGIKLGALVSAGSPRSGDGAHGWGATYDATVLTGSTPVLPDAFVRQLNGGRVFAVIGEAPAMSARLVRWVARGRSPSERCSRP